MSASTPIQTSLNNLSAWASFDTLLQRLDITTEPNFWDGLVMLVPYQDYFLESQYNDLAEGCVPGETIQEGPNKTQTPNPPNQPDPECLCANSPFYAWEIHGIQCTEYRLLYWYHPDYLGHNEFITDNSGLPYQYFHYSAFGETLVEDNAHYGQFSSPYRFNAKELDQETGNYYYGARYYNPTWSIWLSVDAMASKGPNITPYAFSHNNPIMLVDPDGNFPYRFYIRSFHPSESFGGGYGGDDRGWSIDPNARARIHHRVTADPETGQVTYSGRGRLGTFSNASYHPDKGSAMATPDGYIGRVRSSENRVSFETGYEGSNPLTVAPDIDIDARISISQHNDIVSIQAEVAGDDFPNTEMMLIDPQGNTIMLGVDRRADGYDDLPTILFGPATERIMHIDMQIRINPNTGEFLKVLYQGEWIDFNKWNEMQLENEL